MAPSPIPVLIIVVSTLTFQAVLFGSELTERSFPTFDQDQPSCDGDGFFDGISCALARSYEFFRVVGGVIAFFVNLITFNVPGAPWWVRLLVGSSLGGGLLWSVASLFRGN